MDEQSLMTSNRPYLIRAFYEWMVDNQVTPRVLVQADGAGVILPAGLGDEKQQVVLSIGPTACPDIHMDNNGLSFSARFSGRAFDCYVPVTAVCAIFGRENGRGMVFPTDEAVATPPVPPTPPSPAVPPKKRPALKVVK